MKIRTQAWIIFVLACWAWPVFWVVLKIRDFALRSVDTIEDKLNQLKMMRKTEENKP